MSYRLRKLWDKNPKAAARESSFYVGCYAFMLIVFLSDGFRSWPSIWEILVIVLVAGSLIAGFLYTAKCQQRTKDKSHTSSD